MEPFKLRCGHYANDLNCHCYDQEEVSACQECDKAKELKDGETVQRCYKCEWGKEYSPYMISQNVKKIPEVWT
jgi:hypothetical protein